MFGNKSTKHKARYEQVVFTSKLKMARHHKRVPSSPKAQKFRVVYQFIVWHWRLWAVLILCATIVGAVVFYRPLFFVRTVEISGISEAGKEEVQNTVAQFLASRSWFLPNANILLLSEAALSKQITGSVQSVWKVEEVRKEYPHKLFVTVVPRKATFVWYGNAGATYIGNDGTVLSLSGTSEPVLTITWSGMHPATPGAQFFAGDLLDTLSTIARDFKDRTGIGSTIEVDIVSVKVRRSSLTETKDDDVSNTVLPNTANLFTDIVELAEVPPAEVVIRVGADTGRKIAAFKIFLDVGSDTASSLDKLQLLLSTQSADRLANLYYIDMRFGNKAFICLRGTPCATELQ